MEFVSDVLPMLYYIFGIILFIVLIILGIRAIQMLDRAERLLSNMEDKVNTLNGLFSVINKTTNSIDLISSRVIGAIIGIVEKIFKRKKEDDTNE